MTIAVIAEADRKLGCLLSYADALSAAIRRMERIEIDGLRFQRRADIVSQASPVLVENRIS
jgi:hypothetical protein